MRPAFLVFLIFILAVSLSTLHPERTYSAERYPPPDFESGYSMPETQKPPARGITYEIVSVIILAGALCLSAYLAIKKKSRRGVMLLAGFSLLYFGFFRRGCVCPIGAISNVTYALSDSSYVLPLNVLIFFGLPLIFAVFYGRVYCGAVCPHGALQDLVLIKPVRVPRWLEEPLRLFPFFYLGCAVLYAALGPMFVICRYDPFISVFRLSGQFLMIGFAAVFIISSMFIGRAYCRFFCPYGALLSLFSRFSKRGPKITDECINCRLCENSCPVNAIEKPDSEEDE